MSELDVRIVNLESMRVASAHAYSSTPEHDALNKLIAWAKPKGLLDVPKQHRIFGFNNPNPAPGSPNYGYEFWITVESEAESEGEIEIKEFSGGLYAVTRCEVQGDAYDIIPSTWKRLVLWHEDSKYKNANHACLEEHIAPTPVKAGDKFVLDLYLPIIE